MNKDRNPIILLPYDFTEVSKVAVKHATALAKLFDYSITLLNILDQGTKKYMRMSKMGKADLDFKLKEISSLINQVNDVEVNYMIRPASVKAIRRMAEELKVSFIVLGIDKPKGNSVPILKVVSKSRVPVFVVQQKCEMFDYKNIMFPLDDFFASRQKVGWAARLAMTTHAKINIFSVNNTSRDDAYKHQKIVDQVEDFFYKHNIRYATTFSKDGMKGFTQEAIEFSAEQKCDVFVIMHRPNSFFGSIHPIDKELIFNEARIPVMCVNLSEVLITGGIS